MTEYAIKAEHVFKRFRVVAIPKQTTLKELVVSMRFGGGSGKRARFVNAVTDVNLLVPRGATFGIIGKNGSGKTTLMRLIAGIYRPDSGSMYVSGEIAPLLSLGIGFHPDMTGRENVRINGLLLGMTPRQIEYKFDEIVGFAELEDFMDLPVRTYSSGMYMRLAFSIAASVNPDVILLDEILAVGDEAFAAKCLARMREFKKAGKTIVLVTHDPNTLTEWCDSAIWIDQGSVRFSGTPQQVVGEYHGDMQQLRQDAVLT